MPTACSFCNDKMAASRGTVSGKPAMHLWNLEHAKLPKQQHCGRGWIHSGNFVQAMDLIQELQIPCRFLSNVLYNEPLYHVHLVMYIPHALSIVPHALSNVPRAFSNVLSNVPLYQMHYMC